MEETYAFQDIMDILKRKLPGRKLNNEIVQSVYDELMKGRKLYKYPETRDIAESLFTLYYLNEEDKSHQKTLDQYA